MRLRERQAKLAWLRALDVVLVCAAFLYAHLVRDSVLTAVPFLSDLGSPPDIEVMLPLFFVIVPSTALLLELNGYYRTTWRDKHWEVLRSMTLLMLIVGTSDMAFKVGSSRILLALAAVHAVLFLFLRDAWTRRWWLSEARRHGHRDQLLLACAKSKQQELEALVRLHPEGGLADLHFFDIGSGQTTELLSLLHRFAVNRVIVSVGDASSAKSDEVIRACEIEGLEVCLLADFYLPSIAKAYVDEVLGRPAIVLRSAPDTSWQVLVKGLLDRSGALLLLILFSPIFLLVAIAIRITSPGPILFRQQRAGLHGRPFTMLKFRSMNSDAEMQKAELDVFNEMQGPVFKLADDPRVTPLGRFLRKSSVDEFPQLWNVLKGEMSLVGPRPLPLYEVEKFHDISHRRRLSVKPGLTCLWQISGRNQVKDFADWVRMDLDYIDHWTIWLDLQILLRTIPVVLFGRGAS